MALPLLQFEPLSEGEEDGTSQVGEDTAMQQAIAASLQLSTSQNHSLAAAQSESKPTAPPQTPKRRNIDDCIKELTKIDALAQHRHAQDGGADTAVFIDPPAQEPSQSADLYRRISDYYTQPFWVDSKCLMNCNSDYFRARLTPKYQIMTRRRRKASLARLFHEPKYVLDLTPPSEGSDAVALIMELSCPVGIRLWGLSNRRFNVSPTLVLGRDEFEELPDSKTEPSTPDQPDTNTADAGGAQSSNVDKTFYDVPEEYSTLRHRAAIERVLLAIQNEDPQLDSAPKVYCTAVLSKYYGIIGSPLTDYIVRWVRAAPNHHIIEVLPEATLKIADCVNCGPIARDAFAILVGEAVLEMSMRRRGALSDADPNYTAHQRRRGDMDEAWESRIQYASQSLFERVTSQFNSLVKDDMAWVEKVPEWDRLPQGLLETSPALQNFVKALKHFVRRCIYQVCCGTYSYMVLPAVASGKCGDNLFPRFRHTSIWETLSFHDRIFTRTFWSALSYVKMESLDAHEAPENLTFQGQYSLSGSVPQTMRDLEAAGLFPHLKILDLQKKRLQAYRMIYRNDPAQMFPSSASSEATSSPVRNSTLLHPMPESDEPQSPSKRRRSENINTQLPVLTRELRPKPQLNQSADNTDAGSSAAPSAADELLSIRPAAMAGVDVASSVEQSSNTPQRSSAVADSNSQGIEGSSASQLRDGPPSYQQSQKDYWQSYESLSSVSNKPTDDEPVPDPISGMNVATLESLDVFFNIGQFLRQVQLQIRHKANEMLCRPFGSSGDELPLDLTNVLVCIQDSEMKYLPLWAGGLDDGSSGVFTGEIPFADHGFSTHGPGIHGLGSSCASSEYDMADAGSTIGTSTVVNDGYSDTIERRKTYAVDDVESSISWDSVLAHKMQAGTLEDGDKSVSEDWDEIPTPSREERAKPLNVHAASMALEDAADEQGNEVEDYGDIFASSDAECDSGIDDDDENENDDGSMDYDRLSDGVVEPEVVNGGPVGGTSTNKEKREVSEKAKGKRPMRNESNSGWAAEHPNSADARATILYNPGPDEEEEYRP